MATPLRFNQEMGSMQAHLDVWNNRIRTATNDLQAAAGKGEAAMARAQARLDELLQQHAKFLKDNSLEGQGTPQVPAE